MKKIFLIFHVFMLPTIMFAQTHFAFGKTKADYESVMGKFMKFYNAKNADSMCNLFSNKWDQNTKISAWNTEQLTSEHNQIGNMISYKYIGPFEDRIDVYFNPMLYFKLVFDKPEIADKESKNGTKARAFCFSIDKDNKITGIAFTTSSHEIDSMIAKN